MRILVDMNLSPEWLGILSKAGWQASHWKDVGPATAADSDLLAWAREHHAVVITQDLDFSQLLFQTQANTLVVIDERHIRLRHLPIKPEGSP
ncbi:MAG: DUF5615 family PIN-like protein [Verrucomicrobia bacterium]|nr:DUF5615 family PIN-like protein [Verrucomicrobiota bacterium]